MIIALIITLFIIQLITIFVIVILSSKLAKYKTLETRQNQLAEEMDNAISVYLMDMKEENDRFIEELKKTTVQIVPPNMPSEIPPEELPNAAVDAKRILDEIAEQSNVSQQPAKAVQEFEARKFVPIKQAATAYNKQSKQMNDDDDDERHQLEEQLFATKQALPQEQTFEEQVLTHYRNGKSIEEIAKIMQRGTTEIELLVKFHA